MAFLDQNLTDVSFTGKRSYLSLGPVDVEPTKFDVEFQLRPLTNRGLVLFLGRQSSFVALQMYSSFLELTLLAGKSEMTLEITRRSKMKIFSSQKNQSLKCVI